MKKIEGEGDDKTGCPVNSSGSCPVPSAEPKGGKDW